MIETLAARIFRGTIAIGITVSLFVLMNHLITAEAQALGSAEDSTAVRFGPVDLEQVTATIDRKKPVLPKRPVPPPKSPQLTQNDDPTPRQLPMPINLPDLAPGGPDGTIGIPVKGRGMSDSDARIKLAMQPKYPDRARMRKLEGTVTVAFTITETGQTIDATVVASSPPRIFDQEALNAISRWQFWPKIKDGKPVAMRATQTIDFSLENG